MLIIERSHPLTDRLGDVNPAARLVFCFLKSDNNDGWLEAPEAPEWHVCTAALRQTANVVLKICGGLSSRMRCWKSILSHVVQPYGDVSQLLPGIPTTALLHLLHERCDV